MPKVKTSPISDREVAIIATKYKQLKLEKPSSKPNIYKLFKEIGFSQYHTNNWLKTIGGVKMAHVKFNVPDDQITELYNKTRSEIERRVTAGSISDKELLETLKILSGFKEEAVQVNIQQNNISIEDYLKQANITDI